MRDFGTALGLVFVIEGILLALFPEMMKRLAAEIPAIPAGMLRLGGLLGACLGVAAVWLIRRY